MMRKLINILTICIIAGLLSGCGAKGEDIADISESVEAKITADGAASDANVVSDDADNNSLIRDRSQEQEEHKYVHSDEGYYSLVDEGIVSSVKSQLSGTCWVTAIATSLESSYKITNGEDIVVDPVDILNLVLCSEDAEGYIAKEGTDVFDIGGTAWQVAETLSNGFGEYILTEAIDYVGTDRDTIKEAVKKYGALAVGITEAGYHRYDGYKTLIASADDYPDHEVTIIGWDDDFPKEYFKHEASQNGAWYAQNTRGEYWGNGGRYWISYDTPLDELMAFRMTNEYDGVLSYDGGCEGTVSTKGSSKTRSAIAGNTTTGSTTIENTTIESATTESTTTANVFHNKCKIKAVGTYVTRQDQHMIIDIYDANLDKLLYSQEAQFDLKGYYVISLDKELELEDFAIAITYEGEAPVEGEDPDALGVAYKVGINEGESFVSIDGKWLDMADDKAQKKLGLNAANACIKAIY